MIKTEFMRLLEKLDTITEATSSQAPNLADCRMILSDVKDIRGELEASACIEYNGELTRVQVRTVILRDTEHGREFLGHSYGRRVGLPGGGYDMEKDQGDILETAIREAYEEFNLILTDVKDTGLGVWSHRDDPWVTKHVEKEEDRWTGYYSYYVTSKVAGNGDNSQPEEINKWTWLPIEKLKFVNKELYAHVSSLEEAIHPDKEARTDLGEISYLCDSLSTLRMILSRMEIQKTYVPEVRYEVGEHKGNTQRIKQMSLSTSRNLTGHAERRPNKWGFGVILDGQELSRYYDIEYYNHADHKLLDLYLTKVVKLTEEAAKQYEGSRVILMFGEYGNRLISSTDNADLKLYNKLMQFLEQSDYKYKAKPLASYVDRSGRNLWWRAPFGWEGKGKHDSRFVNLLPSDIEELYIWPQPFSKNGVPIKEINEYFHGEFTAMMGTYSSFNEEEERIWVENNLMNFVQIPRPALAGIILPDYFKEDYEQNAPANYHLAWLKKFVTANDLRVDWHSFVDIDHYESGVNKNTTEEDELDWQEYDFNISDARTILTRAKRSKEQFLQGDITKADRLSISPPAIVATAAVKLAIEEHMQDLTPSNYSSKFKTALAAAKKYYLDTLPKGKLTDKPIRQLEELFEYYCPDVPEADETKIFNQDFEEPAVITASDYDTD